MNPMQRAITGPASLDPFGDLATAGMPGIPRPPMHVEVTNRVRDLIVEGRLRPGERINENDLAAFLNVSRTPLREALKELQGEGLIVHEPRKSSWVSHITASHTAELFESLACLEGFCGEIATQKISAAQVRRFTELHEEMYEFHNKRARSEYFELNERIHRAFVILSGNSMLTGMHARLMVGAKRVRYTAIRYEDRWEESVAEHQAILAAMTAGKGQEVRQRLEAHVRGTGECVCKHLAELGVEPGRPRRPLAYEHRLRY